MTTKDILQIVLIPILTLLLTKSWDLISKHRAKNLEKDREVFQSIQSIFEGDTDLVTWFRGPITGFVPAEFLESIWVLQDNFYRPSLFFTVRKLEKLRLDLRDVINEFERFFMDHYKPLEDYEGRYNLEYFDEAQMGNDPEAIEKYNQLANKVRNLSSKISEIYDHFAVVARKKL